MMLRGKKPSDFARMAALIVAIALAKVLMPGAVAEEMESASPVLSQPAPIYVKTIHELHLLPQIRSAQDLDV
jgi:cyanate permease